MCHKPNKFLYKLYWLWSLACLAVRLSSILCSVSTEMKPLHDLGRFPMHSLAASRVSRLKVSHSSTGSSRVSSTPNRLETVTAYSCAHVKAFSFSRWNTVWIHLEAFWTWREAWVKQQQACDRSQRTLHSEKPCSFGGSSNEYWQGYGRSPSLPLQHCYTNSSSAALVSDTRNLQFSAFWILQNSEGKSCCHSWYQNRCDQHIFHSQPFQCQLQH